jgi:hypothetical protein
VKINPLLFKQRKRKHASAGTHATFQIFYLSVGADYYNLSPDRNTVLAQTDAFSYAVHVEISESTLPCGLLFFPH